MTTSPRRPQPRLTDPVHFLACGFGSGLAPKAPGTFGTLAALPLWWLVQDLPLAAYLGLVALLFALGVYLCGRTAQDLGVHDHGGIVWDEIVGYLLTMAAAPPGWGWVLVGFLLFRLFDIVKPWPIRWVDARVTGGLGIMADDVLAAGFAWLLLQGLAWLV